MIKLMVTVHMFHKYLESVMKVNGMKIKSKDRVNRFLRMAVAMKGIS